RRWSDRRRRAANDGARRARRNEWRAHVESGMALPRREHRHAPRRRPRRRQLRRRRAHERPVRCRYGAAHPDHHPCVVGRPLRALSAYGPPSAAGMQQNVVGLTSTTPPSGTAVGVHVPPSTPENTAFLSPSVAPLGVTSTQVGPWVVAVRTPASAL